MTTPSKRVENVFLRETRERTIGTRKGIVARVPLLGLIQISDSDLWLSYGLEERLYVGLKHHS